MSFSTLSVVAALVYLAFTGSVVECSTDVYKAFNESYYKQVYPGQGEDANGTLPLYIAFLISFGGDYTSSGAIPGVQVALDQINADPSILPGYTLHYTLSDTNCTRSRALDAFFSDVVEEPTKIGMIGSGCSVATEHTAEISQYYNITQISCVSASKTLSNRNRFRSYFQLLATENTLAGGFFGIIRKYGWQKIGIITQNENLFTQTMNLLKEFLDGAEVQYFEATFLSGIGINFEEKDLFMENESIRIFVLAMYSQRANDILCEAYRRDIRYPQYLFLTYGWYESSWWKNTGSEVFSCTNENRESVLNNSLAILTAEFIEDPSAIADTAINGSQYQEAYDAHLESSDPSFNLNSFIYGQNCYDATWALVYALNKTITEIASNETLNAILAEEAGYPDPSEMFRLDSFTYHNRAFRDVVFKNFQQTDFNGITGRVQFGQDGVRVVTDRRISRYTFMQGSTDAEQQPVARARVEENGADFDLILHNESERSIWGDGLIPFDGMPTVMLVHTRLALAVFIYILAAAGVVFAIVCLVFNFAFRQRKLIRLSSPNLNYLIGAGAIILYIDLCFFPVPSTDPTAVSVACNLTPWLTALGYSLCYGTIVVKMCRVYYLFHDPLVKKKNIKDWVLIVAVLLLCVVDLIILVVYTAVEGATGNLGTTRVPNRENPMETRGELDIIYQFYVYTCNSQARDIFLGILYGYKAALQIVAVVLSFGIRKVKVKGLDDSKYIAAAVYVTSIVLAVVIVATYTLNDYVNDFPALVSIGFFIGTTFILLLVFIPKMVGLYLDPQGHNVFSKSEQTESLDSHKLRGALDTNVDDSIVTMEKKEIEALRNRVKELEILQLTADSEDYEGKKFTGGSRKVSFFDELQDVPSISSAEDCS